jgi:hypothetical protein
LEVGNERSAHPRVGEIKKPSLAANDPLGNWHRVVPTLARFEYSGGRIEIAQQIAGHESARTTGLYDRRDDEVSLDEIERILI